MDLEAERLRDSKQSLAITITAGVGIEKGDEDGKSLAKYGRLRKVREKETELGKPVEGGEKFQDDESDWNPFSLE